MSDGENGVNSQGQKGSQDAQLTSQNEVAGAVSIKLPQFMESSVMGWFTIAEAQFKLRHITDTATKFYHILSFLPPEVVVKLRPDTLQSNKYENLKEEVVGLYEKSKPEILEKLMSKTVLIGRPSIFLNELIPLVLIMSLTKITRN